MLKENVFYRYESKPLFYIFWKNKIKNVKVITINKKGEKFYVRNNEYAHDK